MNFEQEYMEQFNGGLQKKCRFFNDGDFDNACFINNK